MTNFVVFIVVLAVGYFVVLSVWWRVDAARLARERLADLGEAPPTLALGRERPFLRRYRFVPWLAGIAVAAGLISLTNLPATFGVAFGLIIGLLGGQLEAYLAARRMALIEKQLADAVDLMVGALGAGAGLNAALEIAAEEAKEPLRWQLQEVLGRITLGDDPPAVFDSLARRVPLETFLLFAATLSAQWEVGGSLAQTLSGVGRSIRDRIELSRRLRSNTMQSQFSTLVILLVTYFIALVMWRTNPAQMAAFLSTSLGGAFVSGVMILQAVGMVWMSAMSRMRF